MNACKNAMKISSSMIATAIKNGRPDASPANVKIMPMNASTMYTVTIQNLTDTFGKPMPTAEILTFTTAN